MQCVQSASAVTIIADRMLKERITDTVGRFNIIKVRENLVEIVVKSPEKIVDTAGVIAYLITNLSDAGINIEETVSCHTDTIFIVNEPDMINACSPSASSRRRRPSARTERGGAPPLPNIPSPAVYRFSRSEAPIQILELITPSIRSSFLEAF